MLPMLALLPLLSDHGLELGDITVPWSVVIMVAAIVVGLLLIRTVITLVKVAILVGVGLGLYLLVQFAFDNFR
jgi:hypothetical protein